MCSGFHPCYCNDYTLITNALFCKTVIRYSFGTSFSSKDILIVNAHTVVILLKSTSSAKVQGTAKIGKRDHY